MSRGNFRNNRVKLYKRGQSMLDYVLFLTIIIATLLIMGYYIRNSLSGKYREAADTFGTGEVYSPQELSPGVPNPERTNVTEGVTSPITSPSDTYMW